MVFAWYVVAKRLAGGATAADRNNEGGPKRRPVLSTVGRYGGVSRQPLTQP
jgi:hypothetical protein